MLCQKCKKANGEIKLPYLSLKLCKACFCKLIEKRVKKEIRSKKLINEKEKILLLDNNSKESRISEHIIRAAYNNRIDLLKVKVNALKIGPLSEKTKEIIKKNRIKQVIIPWNLDDEIIYFTENLFKRGDFKFLGHFTQDEIFYIKLLRNVLESECLLFAKCKKFKFKKRIKKDKHRREIKNMLDKINKKHSETKFSLLKSIDNLIKIIKKNTKYSIPFQDNILRIEAPAHKTERHLKFCIDFLLPKGTPIVAARSGTVITCQDRYKRSYKSPKFAGRRNFVVIRHTNGESSIYVHLKHRSIKVKNGQKVRRGQVIALSGQVGFATYPHLHFGVYRGVYLKGGVSVKITFDKKLGPEIPLYVAEALGKYL